MQDFASNNLKICKNAVNIDLHVIVMVLLGDFMSYVEIINLIFSIISGVFALATAYYVVFIIIGLFTYKKYPKAKKQHSYGILICARNEDKVIGNLIESIRKAEYPQDKLEIYVLAHNCTDKTAEVAREKGATVFEYTNSNERTKGYALKKLFECLNETIDVSKHDGYYVFDADNILAPDYFDKMNDAFEYYGMKDTVTSFRNAKNFETNAVSGMYGMLFLNNCVTESRARSVTGCSTRVQGTGFVFPAEIVKEGWNYVTLTEDWEYTADQILRGRKIRYCNEAELFDEQPTTWKIMFRQRIRWAKGHLQVFRKREKKLFKALFAKKKTEEEKRHKFSIYDIMVNIFPLYIVSAILFVAQQVLLAFAPLFQPINIGAYWLNFLITSLLGVLAAYIFTAISTAVVLFVERKRVRNMNFEKKLIVCLCMPVFIALNFVFGFIALFTRHVEWKAIPHVDARNVEDIHKSEETENPKPEISETLENSNDETTEIDENSKGKESSKEIGETEKQEVGTKETEKDEAKNEKKKSSRKKKN